MKTPTTRILLALLVGIGLYASELPAQASPDAPGISATEQATPAPRQVVNGQTIIGNPPEGWVPPSEEVKRYLHFFRELRAWEGLSKQADSSGDSNWAEGFRTMLERRSGLTASEAEQVKKIAFQFFKDEEAWQQRYDDEGKKLRADAPPPQAGQKLVIPAELLALQREHEDLANRAIAQLVVTLGSRSFSKLDLFTRHMDDRMKAAQYPGQPAGTGR